MKISVIGTGYVGLVTGTCFAESGNSVTCVDIDEKKIKKLQSGKVTIYEPGLPKIFIRNQKEGRLQFTTDIKDGFQQAKIIFLALPTPPDEDGSADLKYILGVAKEIGNLLQPGDYKVIVDKSTVPVGTSQKVHGVIMQQLKERKITKGKELFDVVSNPEFLREGAAVEDFMKPNRVIIGTGSEKARKTLSHLYAPFVRQGNPIIYMDERSAELTKYAANSFLATKISFMNEIAQLCERVGANVDLVRKGMGSDERIGKRFLFPGIGYGGSCFPKDVQALWKSGQEVQYDFKIMNAVMDVNKNQKLHLVPKILSYFKNNLKGKKITVWGLAFKPNTDDIREAPALIIISELLKYGAVITAYDPEAMGNAKRVFGARVSFSENQYDALKGADALVVATEWSEFRTPDFCKIKDLMKGHVIFDGRNLFELCQMEEHNFHYESIGRKKLNRKNQPEK
ncbi:MAG: UDP-glucose/GDP-mannose dehydrogenase family protein [Chitinophagaceae bacterium]|nr:UDP-glucose/GDP-mannose dehydrogenase family protein [Chitinophagaceae bacterium]